MRKSSLTGLVVIGIIAVTLLSHISINGFDPFRNSPGKDSALLFGPGIVSNHFGNRDMAISPSGNEFFYTLQQGENISVILYSKKTAKGWSTPEVAPFSGKFQDIEPAFSPDGNRLYFVSKRPLQNGEEKKDYDIWYSERISTGWSAPIHLPAPLNSTGNEFYPSVTRKGDIYFTLDVGKEKEDIVVSRRMENGTYTKPESLSSAINSAGYEFNAFIDPDEEYILFTAHNREGGVGNGDLLIATKNGANEWMKATNPGVIINSPRLDYCPFVTADKKFLFFTSNRSRLKQPFQESKSLSEISKLLLSTGNGQDDIYWIDLKAILNQ